ncbi:hypothetical protein Kpol_1062p23 [Vanderwaltozyma polyspora DSM 70294]|uniref:Ubiquitin carboxyl-terminal hydrolase 2 n=1 Tax=Vanderwaltozyma polyspora (strain ATCC 22028 / DSM 70294 / BCRC 21397 / CBS 2163 / NBRC 10782 / NRRL Y-8283 / UCD 57-17) TaxID=436907 RepID=A7TK80_VANPO|nr:uncharacterized protein Kpol_1062p23 [Vanderwaltozyma polyspora DSM 70294]EDO17315.1 hypothetical protein Kpol_1062p23 [Vanderwaltozyma polyspora DSM 70294]
MLEKEDLRVTYSEIGEQPENSNAVDLENDSEVNSSSMDLDSCGDATSVSWKDDGKQLLYPDARDLTPFKTSERLLDEIMCSVPYILLSEKDESFNEFSNGLLKKQLLSYSKSRHNVQPFSVGTIVDQIILQTKFEYKSTTCPEFNNIYVRLGVLIDTNHQPLSTFDDVADLKIYHLKITVKVRSFLERTKRHVGVPRYHLLDSLHPFDQQDLLNFDPKDPKLVDHAIYVSDDTNKLVLLEIFRPEFDSEEERNSLTMGAIKERHIKASKKYDTLDKDEIPTQIDCINTMFKIFKGPLTRKSNDEPVKTLSSDNVVLNSQMNPKWLVTKYGFQELIETEEETEEQLIDYLPPNLVDFETDQDVRKSREAVTRKCLELIWLGKISISLMTPEQKESASKSLRTFNLLQTSFSTLFWSQILDENKNIATMKENPQMNLDYHLIDLSASYHYTDRDIIQNYELQCKLDPANIGIYFDSLHFIANNRGSYTLIGYCDKQDIVGQEALEQALKTFSLDPDTIDLSDTNDAIFMTIYKNEVKLHGNDPTRLTNLRNALRILAKHKNSSRLKFYVDYEPYSSIQRAFNILEVDESVDDDIIQTAYSIKVNDTPGLKIDCDRALYTVAVSKRSMILINFLFQECPPFQDFYGPDQYTYSEALQKLQVNENAADDTILEIFQRRWTSDSVIDADEILSLKSVLTKIAFERNSKLISSYLETGVVNPGCLPADNWPAGLNNIGNTCYLNSLLQYYFCISPLRNYVADYQKTLEAVENCLEDGWDKRRIGGREINKVEVERSVQFVYQLRDLFNEMIHSSSRCVTPTKELAYLAFAPSNVEVEFDQPNELQSGNGEDVDGDIVFIDEDISEPKGKSLVLDEENSKVENSPENQLIEIDDSSDSSGHKKVEEISQNPCFGKSTDTSTRVAKISFDQLENALELGRQQDVTECIGNVLFQLESASNPISLEEDDEQYDLIKKLFYGKTKQSIIPLKNNNEIRNKIERFVSLLVNVSDHPKDVYDALDLYFSDEYLTMDEYGEVKKSLAVTEFPTILQIQIQRVYYDRERFMPFKSIEPLPFSETIYMDRYTETTDADLLKKKDETFELKKQLSEMRKRQKELLSRNELGLSRKEAFMETRKFLSSDALEKQGIETENKQMLIDRLTGALKDIDDELTKLYNDIVNIEAKIDRQFDKFQNIGYSLFAVFIHRGEASYGHYWVYIKDFTKNGIWRKYNDETITEVPEAEVFNFTEGNTATPYFLVYVKQENLNEIEPLKRIV